MGFLCCGGDKNPDIEKSNSLDDIISTLQDKKKQIPNEMKQIKKYLKDHNFTVENVNVEGINDETLKKRIPYLEKMNNTLENLIETLKSNPDLEVDDVKSHMNNILSKYPLIYDPNGELDNAMKSFEDYVKKHQEEKNKTPK